jgi:hypothetical protein
MTITLAKNISKKLSAINELFPDINHGGCGVFACFFAEKMISIGFDAKIIELSWLDWCHMTMTKEDFAENNKHMHVAAEKHISPTECDVRADSHYCVKVGAYYFDSTVFRKKNGDKLKMNEGNYVIVGPVSLTDMEYISIKDRGEGIWNDMYDSSDNQKIKKFIDKELSLLIPNK